MRTESQVKNLISALERNNKKFGKTIDREIAIKTLKWVIEQNKGIYIKKNGDTSWN